MANVLALPEPQVLPQSKLKRAGAPRGARLPDVEDGGLINLTCLQERERGVRILALEEASRWTKIEQEEVSRTVQVPDGTWHVTHDNKDVCYVGQNYWDCTDEYTEEWNFACTGRAHDASSRELCEQYYDVIQEMKNDAAREEYSEVSGLVQSARLSIRENMKSERVVDVPEQSHEAVCYLGFIGECASDDDAGAS